MRRTILTILYWIQSAAACLVTGARRSEHITPILRDLHWLPIRQQITFKIAVLIYKCQHDMAPQYLQAYCKPMSACSSRRFRSVSFSLLVVPCTRTNYSDHSFAMYGPRVWQSSWWILWLRSETYWRRRYYLTHFFFSAFVASCESALYKCA